MKIPITFKFQWKDLVDRAKTYGMTESQFIEKIREKEKQEPNLLEQYKNGLEVTVIVNIEDVSETRREDS